MYRLLPTCVVTVCSYDDEPQTMLFDVERALIDKAVPERRAEFTTVRACARIALGRLGLPPGPILPGRGGAPIWPAGVVGSMTHCAGYRAAAVAFELRAVAVGIDAEPNLALPAGVLDRVAGPEEIRALAGQTERWPDLNLDRVLFSAKESVYKAWYPITGRFLDFRDVDLSMEPAAGTFEARLRVPGPQVARQGQLTGFSGRFRVGEGLLMTAVALRAAPPQLLRTA